MTEYTEFITHCDRGVPGEQIEKWCREQFGSEMDPWTQKGRWAKWEPMVNVYHWCIPNEQDAVIFSLRWPTVGQQRQPMNRWKG